MGGNEGGQPMHNQPMTPDEPAREPGTQPGPDWGHDQQARDQQGRDRQVETNQRPTGSPDDNPMQEDEIGSTPGAGSEGAPRH